MRPVTFHITGDGLLNVRRWPIKRQEMAYCNPKGYLLEILKKALFVTMVSPDPFPHAGSEEGCRKEKMKKEEFFLYFA